MTTTFGTDLPPTVIFDYPTPAALASWIAESVADFTIPAPATEEQKSTEDSLEGERALRPDDSITKEVVSIVETIVGTSVASSEPLMSNGLDSLGKTFQ